MLMTISYIRARVFIMTPMMEDSRQGRPLARAARVRGSFAMVVTDLIYNRSLSVE